MLPKHSNTLRFCIFLQTNKRNCQNKVTKHVVKKNLYKYLIPYHKNANKLIQYKLESRAMSKHYNSNMK